MKKIYKKIYKKILVCGIMLLFLGAGAILNTSVSGTGEGDPVELNFSFSEPVIENTTINTTIYDRIIMSDLSNSNIPGEPRLPIQPVNVLIPQNYTIEDINVTAEGMTFLNGAYFVEPGQQPYPISYNWSNHTGPIETPPNATIYTSSQHYPDSTFQSFSIQKKRGYHILPLNLYPVRYIPNSQEIYYYTNMSITISLTSTEPDLENYRNLTNDENIIKEIVDNPDVTGSYTEGYRTNETYKYVIITNATFENVFQDLANWKETRGKYTEYMNISTNIVLVEDIVANSSFWYDDDYWGDGGNENVFNDTQCKIRNFIKMAFNNWSTEYVLLGGDVSIIPCRKFYNNYWIEWPASIQNVTTDLYYSCLDGTHNYDEDEKWGEDTDGINGSDIDLIAEVFIGRAPVDKISDCINFTAKTIAYENITNDSYLKKAMMIGADLDPISEGANSKDKIMPIIPQYTTTKIYNRDGTYDEDRIFEEMINETPHIINYVGHSTSNYDCGVSNNNLPERLTNDEYFFIYSIGCHAASFHNDDAIAEVFLVKSEGGAFAYIGNSHKGIEKPGLTNGPSDKFDKAFFQVLMESNTTHIGKILQDSKERVGIENDPWDSLRTIYCSLNLLGDPETQLKTEISAPTAHFKPTAEYRLSPPINNGVITLKGTAKKGNMAGSTFDHYMIEYGSGLNPTTWNTVGITLIDNGQNEITDDTLGYWDTSQVNDYYYTLRLTVYDNNTEIGQDWVVMVVANAFTVENNDTGIDYNSIGEAVKKASAGNTIFVGNGTYYETILLPRQSINIIGEDKETTIVNRTPCGGQGVFTIDNNPKNNYKINISNFTIEGEYAKFYLGDGIFSYRGLLNSYISNCIIRDQYNGINFILSNSNIISNCDFYQIEKMGIRLYGASWKNIIKNCNFIDNEHGIYSDVLSGKNEIINCSFINNSIGIKTIDESSNNTITKCNFIDSASGIRLYTNDNTIHSNNFINNNCDVYLSGSSSNNTWDNGYPFGGNYWDEYMGVDNNHGPNQNISGSDGIGDTAFNVSRSGNNQDKYPLMEPWGTVTPEITNVSHIPNIGGNGGNITITADIYSIGIDTVKVCITYPDSSYKEHIMNYAAGFTHECVFNDTWQKGQYNYTICVDAGIVNYSSEYSFSISSHCDISLQTVKNIYYLNEYVNLTNSKIDNIGDTDCQGYLRMNIEYNDSGNWILEEETVNETTARTILHGEYLQLDSIFNDKANTSNLFHETGQYRVCVTLRDPQGNILINDDDTLMQSYCEFNCILKITNVSNIPEIIGHGYNVTISADIIDDVNNAMVNITYPDESIESFTMNHVAGIKYECVFNDTWQKGQYNYTIWVVDNASNVNYSSGHTFIVSSHCRVSIQTLKDEYVSNENINITDIDMLDGDWLNINSTNLDSYCGLYLDDALDGTSVWWCSNETHTHWFILDLGQAYTITQVKGRSNIIYPSGGDDPTDVNIYVSEVNGTWRSPVKTNISTWQDTTDWQIVNTSIKYGRYVKVEIKNTKHILNRLAWGDLHNPMAIFDVNGTETIYSLINNVGDTGCKGHLQMGIEYNNNGNWTLEEEIINETTPRTIVNGSYLKLDNIFNGKINTSVLDDGHYRVYAKFCDPDGNVLINDDDTGMIATYEFNIAIYPPEIDNVTLIASDPLDTDPNFGWENITCDVTDNVGVNEVKLITTTSEYLMTRMSGTDTYYYYNTIFTDDGCHQYYIWAEDINGVNATSSQQFELPPNHDVDMDGQTYFMDLTAIVLMYDEHGRPPGWVREDVDNDGHVYFMDLVQVDLHYGEYWDTCGGESSSSGGGFGGNAVVSIQPSSQTVEKGETFTVSVYVEPDEAIMGASFASLSFDSSLIHANSVTEGNLFNNHLIFSEGDIDNENGMITDVYIITEKAKHKSGNLVDIEFTAQQEIGISNLVLEGVIVTNENNKQHYLEVNDGSVMVE